MTEPLIPKALQETLRGKPVAIHASMRSFRPRIDADALLDAVLDIDCTVLVPAFTYALEQPPPPDGVPDRNGMDVDSARAAPGHDRRYDARGDTLSLADMGALPQAVLRRARERGEHPLNSFAAIGPLARELIGRQTLQNVYGPFDGLLEHDGLVVLAGVGCTSMTLVHFAEERAGRRLFQRWAKDRYGRLVACATGSCSVAFDRFEPVLEGPSVDVSGSTWRILDANAATRAATDAILADASITACGRRSCLRCRDAVAGGPVPATPHS